MLESITALLISGDNFGGEVRSLLLEYSLLLSIFAFGLWLKNTFLAVLLPWFVAIGTLLFEFFYGLSFGFLSLFSFLDFQVHILSGELGWVLLSWPVLFIGLPLIVGIRRLHQTRGF